jgi:HTH-type transcriptional repressor of NAD biosynthesis genes
MKKTGLTLGKYAPMHKGHQYVIETALREMDELFVMIYDSSLTDIPLHIRSRWIKSLYPAAKVIEAWDGPEEVGDTPEIKKLNEDYILSRLRGTKITHFYSNEFYGDHVSVALGAENRQIDRNRDMFKISARSIREDPYKYREFVDPLVYRDLVMKVVFLGAMSTGKTTICEALAKKYGTVWMPEYGREYWEQHHVNRRVTPVQLAEIARVHVQREDALAAQANRYLFVDTNAITTYMFAMDYHGVALPELEALAMKAQSRYDLCFLCREDIPYDDTWDRSGDQKRLVFQKMTVADLNERKVPYIELSGTLEERIAVVDAVLRDFRRYRNPVELSTLVDSHAR